MPTLVSAVINRSEDVDAAAATAAYYKLFFPVEPEQFCG